MGGVRRKKMEHSFGYFGKQAGICLFSVSKKKPTGYAGGGGGQGKGFSSSKR